ncbi:unnamed protein product [Linum trigynum]|uniref:Alpha/beta hydrolase fold-3 domain-containing protein n=2 Tax=Linum trigynum TaxID=586398 RepID=A0AAV2EXN1_9ROSI
MRRKQIKMASTWIDPRFNRQLQTAAGRKSTNNNMIKDEIPGLIRVYEDGRVERPPIIPTVPCTSPAAAGVTSTDAVIDGSSNLWARVYVPVKDGYCSSSYYKLPVLVYFHGGGFCVGSAAWSCYHSFLSGLAGELGCVIFSVNYRLAPEHRLPAAYDDGLTALAWITSEDSRSSQYWWSRRCNLSTGVFLAGDSAGANIAYNVARTLFTNSSSSSSKLRYIQGLVLIQPFFGGETRTPSEKNTHDMSPNSPLTLSAADTYWRLSLPFGANRDHPFCNPLAKVHEPRLLLPVPAMVCISEMDVLRDRSLDFCDAASRAAGTVVGGKKAAVEAIVYRGVGHAFHVLERSAVAQIRAQEMVSHIKKFVHQ